MHFTLSRRPPPAIRTSGTGFDPNSPFHFVNRASVSLRTPKHVFYSFGILTIAAVYPTGRSNARGNGLTHDSEHLGSKVSDAWYIGAFGRWWRGGIVQSWWHEMLANTKDSERCGSGILDVKALDVLEGLDGESFLPQHSELSKRDRTLGLSFPTPSRLPTDASNKLRGTERSTTRAANNIPRSITPPPLPKSASLPLHAPRVPASSPPKVSGSQSQRHATTFAQTGALVASEPLRPPAPPVLGYSSSSTSLWDSSPIIAEVLRQISQSKLAVNELRTQLSDFRQAASDSRTSIQTELDAQRERKREEDAARTEIKSRTKILEDSKRSADSSKRDVEKRLRAAESARDNAAARIEQLGEEIGVLRSRMREDKAAVASCKKEGDVQEAETQETLERKRKEIKVAEEVVAALNMRAKELEEKIAQEEERLRRAKEQAELKKKQDRSFYPLTVVPAEHGEDIAISAWSPYANQTQAHDALTHSSAELVEQELFPQPIRAPKSKGSVSSGSGSDNREVSVSPRPARLSLTGISNLREPINRALSDPDPNVQVLLRPRGFPVYNGDLPSTLSTQSTSTRFSPFGDSDDAPDPELSAGAHAAKTNGLSPISSSYIPKSLINSLDDGAGSFDNFGLARSFQSEDDTVLSRDWRKNAPVPPPLPVENPGNGIGMYTTSPLSLTCPTFDGVDREDPFEVRAPLLRRYLTSDMDMQRALPPSRTISDPPLPPVGLTGQIPETEIPDKTGHGVAHRRWASQQDAAEKRTGLNPEAKAFSLTGHKKSFPSLFSTTRTHPHPTLAPPYDSAFDSAPGPPLPSGSLSSHSHTSLSIPSIPASLAEPGSLFSSISMRAFAPSPAEREALQRALGGSTNTSLERLPTLSEVSTVSSSIPSLSGPSSPSHTHAHAAPPGLGIPSAGPAFLAKDNAFGAGFGFGNGTTTTLLGPGFQSWLQSFPRRKPKFSPWDDEELEAGGAAQ